MSPTQLRDFRKLDHICLSCENDLKVLIVTQSFLIYSTSVETVNTWSLFVISKQIYIYSTHTSSSNPGEMMTMVDHGHHGI